MEALRELRTKKQDLSRVIDPDEEQNERGSRPISGGLSLATEIPRECQAPDGRIAVKMPPAVAALLVAGAKIARSAPKYPTIHGGFPAFCLATCTSLPPKWCQSGKTPKIGWLVLHSVVDPAAAREAKAQG